MRAVVVLVLAVATAACGLVIGLKVEPVKAAWSGKADPEDGVSQGLTINFDELDSASGAYCELFVGSRANGGQYHLSVLTNPGGFPIGSGEGNGNADHQWVRFKVGIDVPDSIVKGKKLTFKFTRSGGDSIQYYYQTGDPYRYGLLTDPNLNPAPLTWDLACRVYGRMKTGGQVISA